ncbi:MAR1 protein, partial [Struthidea cinerea]|nr:MAR1 protein [Struthidea cinerea]
MPRRYNHLDGNYFKGKGHTYFAAEEALGIGLLILVLGILLAFGCWYYKRRSGYKSLQVSVAAYFPSCYMSTIRKVVGEEATLGCKMALQDYRDFNSVV